MSEHRSDEGARSGANGSDERSREEPVMSMSEHRSDEGAGFEQRAGANGSDERSREEPVMS
jgi:hypothetical protein